MTAGFTSNDTCVLRDPTTDAHVDIVQERGGLVAKFDIGEASVLYLDEATLADRSKNVRGGVPVLFPTPGKLADDAWAYAGKRGSLKQHGFARNERWAVTSFGESSVTLALEWAGDAASWPWACTLEIAFSLRARTLRLDQRVINRAGEAMPFGLGFHPYFHVPDRDKPRARVATAATRAFDNVSKREIAVAGPIDLTAKELDLHLLDHGKTACALELPTRTVELRGSREFTHWVVWTLAGKDFVCVEPWTCPGNALNTGERLLVVAPGATHEAWTEIEYVPRP
jgi:galactose mutarotase-like enzyme